MGRAQVKSRQVLRRSPGERLELVALGPFFEGLHNCLIYEHCISPKVFYTFAPKDLKIKDMVFCQEFFSYPSRLFNNIMGTVNDESEANDKAL